MRKGLAFILLGFGCSTPAKHAVPGASITPHRDARPSGAPCSYDARWNGDAAPDVTYAFGYDASGQLAHVEGVYAAGGADDSIDYSYDAAGRFTHMVESNAPGGVRVEESLSYDAAGNLVGYAWSESAAGGSSTWTETYADFDANGNPARGTGTSSDGNGGSWTWSDTFAYDASGRLVSDTEAGSDNSSFTTTYAYDDQAGTLVMDTNQGAFHTVYQYDAGGDLLSVTQTGSDPSEIDSTAAWQYDAGEVVAATFQSGTQQAPHALATVEVDSYHYDCAAARTQAPLRFAAPRGAARARR